ncbi:MAG: anhydro-N-acetylmuramic acid kinase [Sedimentisphaerales bacterium]|nr:anhydro-N-acetylmuramic acid kinase [Sedimentisphaerales bacterium]
MKVSGQKKKQRVAGLMSGTSADGVDVAVVDVDGRDVNVLEFKTYRYPRSLRDKLLALCESEICDPAKVCHVNAVLGEVFGEAVIRLCSETKLPLESVDLIGSHGHTLYHQPAGKRYKGKTLGSTLQIGEPCIIAQRTGICTVADFRPRDMAVGGQGAPLVPYADHFLFSHPKKDRIVQNIGGIANLTWLSAGGTLDDVIAFDTGPGNMVIDAVVCHVTKGKMQFDRNGRMAGRGKVHNGLLKELLRDSYFRKHPPKSTGREWYGKIYVGQFLSRAKKLGLTADDMTATVTQLTSQTIAEAYRRFLPRLPEEVILCGGGARNATLVKMLQKELPAISITTTSEFGIEFDAKEAISFAILAYATIRGMCNNVPSATGAAQPVILGKIVPGR